MQPQTLNAGSPAGNSTPTRAGCDASLRIRAPQKRKALSSVPTPRRLADQAPGLEAWKIGAVEDHSGRIHFGVVIHTQNAGKRTFVDLVAPIGASAIATSDLDRVVILSMRSVRQIINRSVSDHAFMSRLLDLTTIIEARSS